MGSTTARKRVALCAALLGSMSLTTAAGAADEFSAMVDAADPAKGKDAFEICAACHAIGPDEPTLIGPTLWQVEGRDIASVEGFAYSPGFKTTDVVWDEAHMDQFIANPNSLFPGNNMATFAGLSNESDRKAIIDYLKTLK